MKLRLAEVSGGTSRGRVPPVLRRQRPSQPRGALFRERAAFRRYEWRARIMEIRITGRFRAVLLELLHPRCGRIPRAGASPVIEPTAPSPLAGTAGPGSRLACALRMARLMKTTTPFLLGAA